MDDGEDSLSFLRIDADALQSLPRSAIRADERLVVCAGERRGVVDQPGCRVQPRVHAGLHLVMVDVGGQGCAGRLRVLLLRRAFAASLRTSFAVF